jgi:hypothetical protein
VTSAGADELRRRHAELLTIAVERGFDQALPEVEAFRELCRAVAAAEGPAVGHGLRMLAKRFDHHWHAECYMWLERKPDTPPLPYAARPELAEAPAPAAAAAAAGTAPSGGVRTLSLGDVGAGTIAAQRWTSAQFARWLRAELPSVGSPRRLRLEVDRLLAEATETLCREVLVPGVVLVVEDLRLDRAAAPELRDLAAALGGSVASRSFLHLRPAGWRDRVPVFDVRWGEAEEDEDDEATRISPWVNDRDLDRVVSRGLGYLQVQVAEDVGLGATLAFLSERVSALGRRAPEGA